MLLSFRICTTNTTERLLRSRTTEDARRQGVECFGKKKKKKSRLAGSDQNYDKDGDEQDLR